MRIALFCGVLLLLYGCGAKCSSSNNVEGNAVLTVIGGINCGEYPAPLPEKKGWFEPLRDAWEDFWKGEGQPSDAQYPKWWNKKQTKSGKKHYGYGYGKTRALATMKARIEIVEHLEGVEISTYTGCLEAWISEYSRSEEAALRRNSDSVKECYENNETGSAGHLKGSWVEKSAHSKDGEWTFVRVLHKPKR